MWLAADDSRGDWYLKVGEAYQYPPWLVPVTLTVPQLFGLWLRDAGSDADTALGLALLAAEDSRDPQAIGVAVEELRRAKAARQTR